MRLPVTAIGFRFRMRRFCPPAIRRFRLLIRHFLVAFTAYTQPSRMPLCIGMNLDSKTPVSTANGP